MSVAECYNKNEQVIAYSIEAISVVSGCGISLLSNSDEDKLFSIKAQSQYGFI